MGASDQAVAAIEGFPPQYTRFITACESSDHRYALGLILLNPDEDPYPMMVWLESAGGCWTAVQTTELVSEATDYYDDSIGKWVTWAIGRVPSDVRIATLKAGNETTSSDIVDGWYVLAIWRDRPCGRSTLALGSSCGPC